MERIFKKIYIFLHIRVYLINDQCGMNVNNVAEVIDNFVKTSTYSQP